MDASTNQTGEYPPLHIGSQCLLVLEDRRCLVAVLSAQQDTVRVSFPTRDYPPEGARVGLEIHDEHGYASYACEVLEAAREVGDGLLLKRRPAEDSRIQHRQAWRADTSFPVHVKRHAHPRPLTGRTRNISALGMLLETECPLETGENFDFTIELPGGPIQGVGIVVEAGAQTGGEPAQYGVRFVGMDRPAAQAISSEVWRTLRQRYQVRPPQ